MTKLCQHENELLGHNLIFSEMNCNMSLSEKSNWKSKLTLQFFITIRSMHEKWKNFLHLYIHFHINICKCLQIILDSLRAKRYIFKLITSLSTILFTRQTIPMHCKPWKMGFVYSISICRGKKYWFGYTKWFVCAITALSDANAKIIN